MQNVLNPLMNMYQSQLDVSRKCADAVFSGTEKIDRMLIGATHRVFTEQLNFVQAIATVRDPKAMGNVLQSGLIPRTPDEAVNYQREIIRIFSDMQHEIGRSFQEYVEQIGGQAASTAARPLGGTQETQANDAAFNPMTSMFSVWESAFKDVAALAKKNMTVARSSVDDVASRARQTATNYADVTAAGTQQAAESTASAAKSAIAIGEEEGAEEKRGSPSGGTKRK